MLHDGISCGIRNEDFQKMLLSNNKLTLTIVQLYKAVTSEVAQEYVTKRSCQVVI